MTKETQTQAIAEPFKFKNAALLYRLSKMAQVPYYATACHTLIQAEMAIVELERENATLRAEVERLAAQAAPSSAIIASLCGDVKPVAYMFEFPDKRVAPKFDSAPHGGNWQKLYPASTVAALKAENDALRSQMAEMDEFERLAFEAHPNLHIDITAITKGQQ